MLVGIVLSESVLTPAESDVPRYQRKEQGIARFSPIRAVRRGWNAGKETTLTPQFPMQANREFPGIYQGLSCCRPGNQTVSKAAVRYRSAGTASYPISRTSSGSATGRWRKGVPSPTRQSRSMVAAVQSDAGTDDGASHDVMLERAQGSAQRPPPHRRLEKLAQAARAEMPE